MMPTYAASTSVSTMKSREEIEKTLMRYGADQFMHGWDANRAIIAFQAHGRQVRFLLPLPDREDREFTHTPERRTRRSDSAALAAWEQACRQRWRALSLVIKAKLEAVEAGITEFDDEFLAHLMLPDGSTVGERTRAGLEAAFQGAELPALMPGS